MKTSYKNLIAVVAAGVVTLAGNAALAGCNGGGNGGGGYGGGYNGGNNGGYNGGGNYGNYNNNNQDFGQALEPFHSTYTVLPGDSFYVVSLKEYGTSSAAKQIARFNRLPSNAALVPGQRLFLPSISASGRLTKSRAPAEENFDSPVAQPSRPTPKFVPASSITTTPEEDSEEPAGVSVPTGSTLQLDGQSLGESAGVVRLKIGSVAFPVEVVEWSDESTKVRLPKLNVTEPTTAELEVVRADGSVAASNAIQLTTTSEAIASSN
jgi:hypothetical protein